MGSYQYKFEYAGTPVFKQAGGKERYLYWSQKQSEWMVTFQGYFSLFFLKYKLLVTSLFYKFICGNLPLQIGGGVLSKLPFLRSPCTERYPQYCKDKWGAQYDTFDLNLTCGNTIIGFLIIIIMANQPSDIRQIFKDRKFKL